MEESEGVEERIEKRNEGGKSRAEKGGREARIEEKGGRQVRIKEKGGREARIGRREGGRQG